jgi:hypothetical protein
MLVDFERSSISWLTENNSYGVFRVESALFQKGQKWLLGAGVYACDVYGKGPLIKDPPYFFQAAFSESDFVILRTYYDNITGDSFGSVKSHFKSHEMRVSELTNFQFLKSGTEIKQGGKYMAEINSANYSTQFPIKHFNWMENEFQIETGPVLLPFENSLCTAYLAFQNSNEFHALIMATQESKKRTTSTICEKNCEIKIVELL